MKSIFDLFDLTVVLGDESAVDGEFVKYVTENRVDLVVAVNLPAVSLERGFEPGRLRGYTETVLASCRATPKSVDLTRRKVEFKTNVGCLARINPATA